MDALIFLDRIGRAPLLPLYVVHGDEPFLKRQVIQAVCRKALGAEAAGGVSTHVGDKTTFAAVFDELAMAPLFEAHRVVIVDNADPFVTQCRAALEKQIGRMPATGTLILDVKSWAANTRLAKLVADAATVVCKAMPAHRLPAWCVNWASRCQGKELTTQAAALLVDLVGPDMGLLDQELAKLAIYVGERQRIDAADVDRLVGLSRAENTWKIFDAIGNNQPAAALAIIGRLCDQGEEPLRLLGAFSWQLRRLAQAARLTQQGLSLPRALAEVGVPPFGLKAAEQQLRHLGRRRADCLYDWLLELDLGLKGGSPLPPRTLLERFILRLARQAV